MKIAYITSIALDKKQAQAVQVSSMIRAFSELLGNDFLAITCSSSDVLKSNTNLIVHKTKFNGKIKKFLFPFLTSKYCRDNLVKFVYCREIFIALFHALCGRTVIYELHEFNNIFYQKWLLKLALALKNILFVTVSNQGKIELQSISESVRCEALPNGVFCDDYLNAIQNKETIHYDLFSNSTEKYKFVYTGSLYKGNDADIIFMMANVNLDIAYFCVGGSSKEFIQIWEKFGSPKNVYHIKHVSREKVIDYQSSADALVYPISNTNTIKNYTSPLKLFEYMASGRPIIGKNLGAVKEILTENNAYIFTDENIKSVICEVIFDLDNNNYKGQDNRELAKNKYSWEARVSKILDMFNSEN
ncbi:predicted glycosyltransferase [Vibrio alginolyticus 12G01]|uniref:glycosyltransferase n=1 Tax=Vibrio alginolyticus TaxID=663 RepID=UPI0000D552FA|nr:glycosyltransferase [Vibrio alginolyticus]EAS75363.1 predicted glycosyltransferase [Vibrio alginolyticus 12G01]